MNANEREYDGSAAAMTVDKFLAEIRSNIAGHIVKYRRLVTNSLLLYIDSGPDEPTGYVIWLEPTWHVSSSKGVLIGSRQAQVQTKAELGAAGKPLDELVGHRVESIAINGRTKDLTVLIEGDFEVRTFVSDATADHIWHIDDRERQLALYASALGFDVQDRAEARSATNERK